MQRLILIIDDEVSIRKFLQFHLDKNYRVITMESGKEALIWLNEGNFPDVIVTDINMPFVDGKLVIKELKSQKLTNAIPIIVMSANSNGWGCAECLEVGAEDFILKPIDPFDLQQKIKEIISRGAIFGNAI